MARVGRIVCSLFVLLLVGGIVFADDPVADKFMSTANDRYSAGDYEKAYSYINRVLDLYRDGSLPDNAAVLAEMIYYAYIGELRANENEDALPVVKVWLGDFPVVESSRIKTLIAAFENDIQKRTRQSSVASSSAGNTAASSNDAALRQELEAQRQEREAERQHEVDMISTFTSQLSAQTESLQNAMELSARQNETSNRTILLVVLVIGIILVVVFIVVIISVVINSRQAKKQQEQFAATLQVVAVMNRIPSEHLMLDGVTDVYGDSQLRLVGGSSASANGLPEPEVDEKELHVIREFAVRCEQIGNEIDVMTGRKNNSKNISEMVYKISMELGIRKDTAMLYFCAAMVYDIGFLSLEKDLLQAETLTEEQKYSIRAHVKPDDNAFEFIPEKYRAVFTQAAATHHENMDGSGYPAGLKGNDIPLISRIIHVVESFVSLISRRNYRAIFDKESAIQELRNHPELYDESIVDVLDSIV